MPAPGGMNLISLIASMKPELQPGSYVFATVPPTHSAFQDHLKAHPFEMLFRESEGWTLIAPPATVEALGLEAIFLCRKITLGVHSSLDAVGFMAAVTTRLAEAGLGVNPVSGFYHDHLFVADREQDRVVDALQSLAEEAAIGLGTGGASS